MQATFTMICTIESTEAITIRGTNLELPCELIPGLNASGTVRMTDVVVDTQHQDPPYLFGAGGVGVGSKNDTGCQAVGAFALGQQPPVLQPNSPRYLATLSYEATGCGGDFNFEFLRFSNPPRAADATKIRGQNNVLIPFAVPITTVPVVLSEGSKCDDGMFCTAIDRCEVGVCRGAGNPCPGQACDEEAHACVPVLCPPSDNPDIDPTPGLVDARQPHPVDDSSVLARQGIGGLGDEIVVTLGVTGAIPDCFFLCESAPDGELGENAVVSVTEAPEGVYTLELAHAIAPGAATTFAYGETDLGTYVAHPGNTNGDTAVNISDVQSMILYLHGLFTPPHGPYSVDLDHSGRLTPLDLVRLIDLFNAAGSFAGWSPLRPQPVPCP